MSGKAPSDLARSIVRTRVHEEVTELGGSPRAQEARLQQVEAAASTTAAMTYEQLVIFHNQQQALAQEVALRQQQQQEMAIQLSEQQASLGAQQAMLMTKLAEQEKATREHDKAFHHVSNAFGAQSRAMDEVREEMNTQARRQSGRWGLFEEKHSKRLEAVEAATAEAAQKPWDRFLADSPKNSANLAGVQQVPMAPVYKGSTRK